MISEERFNDLRMTPDEMRELSLRFFFGVTVGELVKMGATEDEMCMLFEASLQAALDHSSESR